jgi:hypothetical protein
MRRVLASALVLALAPVAAAQSSATKPAETVAGAWKFLTGPLGAKGCVISGDIIFKKAKPPLAWSCEFVSREDCRIGDHTRFQKVKQTCEVREVRGELEVTSTVVRVLDAGPPDQKEDLMRGDNYWADNFILKLPGTGGARPGEMVGTFKSINIAKARFWRPKDLSS